MDPSQLLLDEPELLVAAARDFGDIVHDRPAYVARPRSTEEVAAVVRHARREGLPVAARGVGHSAGGQAQVGGGIVVDTSHLARMHRVDAKGRWFEADAGLRWRELMGRLLPEGLTPPVVTDWLELSLGGTTTAGGVGAQSFRHGLQSDVVESMTVVVGTGEIVECSADREPELFDAVRGGLGQYGIITRVRMRVSEAPRRVVLDHLVFDGVSRFVDAVEVLMDREVDGLLAHAVPRRWPDVARSLGVEPDRVAGALLESEDAWVYDLEVLRYARPEEPPPVEAVGRELGAVEGLSVRRELSFSDFIHRVPPIIERDQRAGRAPHPELAMFVPHRSARTYFEEAMGGMRHEDLGGGPVLIIPLRPGLVRSPYVRLPDDERAWLLGILRAAPRPELVEPMTRANVALWRRGTELGALRYPVDSVPQPSNPEGWEAHFGALWTRACAAKRVYDPDALLAPRLGVFAGV